MVDSPVKFTVLNNLITSIPIFFMMVSFILVTHGQKLHFQEREWTRVKTTIQKFLAQSKAKNWTPPKISSDIYCLTSTRVVYHDSKPNKISTIW